MEFRKLRADEIELRAQTIRANGLSLLCYKDARCDMNILDETVGPENWQRSHEVINGNLFCNVGIKCGDAWVWKQDVGTESNTEKEKGEASDSFKRACFNWGIGRELYTSPFIWISSTDANIKTENGKSTSNERFKVSDIEYAGNKISYMKIVNAKTNKAVFSFGNPKEFVDVINQRSASAMSEEPKTMQRVDPAEETEETLRFYAENKAILMRKIVEHDINREKLASQYKVNKVEDLNIYQILDVLRKIEKKEK